jgi:hypothetical protein
MTFSRGLDLLSFFCQMMLYQVAAHGSFGVGADPRVRPGAGAHRGAPLQKILLLLTATWY